MPEKKKAYVTGVRLGNLHVEIAEGETKSVKEVFDELGLKLDGSTVILNGVRLSEDVAATTPVKPGDTVERAGKGDGGR